MIADEDLRRDGLETHLSEVMGAAVGDPNAAAQLEEMAPGIEGRIEIVSMGSQASPMAGAQAR